MKYKGYISPPNCAAWFLSDVERPLPASPSKKPPKGLNGIIISPIYRGYQLYK